VTDSLAIRLAVAVELRRKDTDAVMGIALIVRSQRHVSWLSEKTGAIATPALSDEAWRDVDAWDEAVAARLPRKPEPMPASTVDALLGPQSEVVARRFAAIPILVESRDALTPLLTEMLPGLLKSRRAA
jgi:hypothetical protein